MEEILIEENLWKKNYLKYLHHYFSGVQEGKEKNSLRFR